MKVRLTFLASILLLLGSAHAVRCQYLHPKIVKKEIVLRNLVILPAKVDIVRQSMRGPEGMAAESDMLSTLIPRMLVDVLTAKHLTAMLSAPAQDDPERKYARADIDARYDALLPKITKKPKDVTKGRFSMGDEIMNLNADKTVDAIVFVRGHGQKLSKGKSTFSLLTLSPQFPYLALSISIVDANTGEVLVFANPSAVTDATSGNQAPLRSAIEKSLKKLPLAN